MSTVTPFAVARAAGRCASPAPRPASAAAVRATAAGAIISIGVERVVDPFLAHAADTVVHGLRPLVVGRGLPLEPDGAALATALDALLDQRLGVAAAAAGGVDVEVVHRADARGARRRPGPEDRRQPD